MNRLLLLIISLLIASCGKGLVNLDEQTFQPKIVIQGTLFPHHKVDKIKISRNFPLNTIINNDTIVIQDATVTIFDDTGTAYRLTFNTDTGYYEYIGTDLVIEYGKSYTLKVTATIDDRELHAKSTTTVPEAGFEILESQSVLDSMFYRERDLHGELKNFDITFKRSPGTDFYALSLTALDADTATFIYDNPFGDFNAEDVLDDFQDFKYTYTWIQDTPGEQGESNMEIFWFFIWFYGDYQAIIYAADKNFKDFLQTHNEVQEIDGNFHEPAFHIEGHGIGVFGSAIADTVYFRVLK
ncbi:MAG: DUF4249 family protein [bacterium]